MTDYADGFDSALMAVWKTARHAIRHPPGGGAVVDAGNIAAAKRAIKSSPGR
jgi:hypothetical protein